MVLLHNISNKKFSTWLIARSDLSARNISDIIKNSELIVSDLDDTDAPSPALNVVSQDFLSGRRMFDFDFYSWCLKYGFSFNDARKASAWKDYSERFLSTPEENERLKNMFNLDFVLHSLYKGVRHFYNSLNAKRDSIYLTRNIQVISEAYACITHTLRPVCVSSKIEGIQKILERHHEIRRFIVKGDSQTDEEVVNYLKSIGKEVFAIQVAKNKSKARNNFDLVIPRDYRGLNELLGSN